jgi:hypothetical protein
MVGLVSHSGLLCLVFPAAEQLNSQVFPVNQSVQLVPAHHSVLAKIRAKRAAQKRARHGTSSTDDN